MNELSPIALFPSLEEMVADRVRYDELIFLDKVALMTLHGTFGGQYHSPEDRAKKCYEIANAMLEERRRLHLNQQEKKENP